MLSSPFYHGIIRKCIVSFGSLFSNLKIERKLEDSVNGATVQTIAVPIAYAPKEKWLVRIEQDPTLSNNTYTALPRMSFEITGISYDQSRKLNRINQITCYQQGAMTSTRVPVPYNIEISLYVLTKTQEDALQIIEQIIPYFNPEYNLSVRFTEDINTNLDVPVVLNSISVQDEYDGDFQTRRFVTYTLDFTLKANVFGDTSASGYIEETNVSLSEDSNLVSTLAKHTASVDIVTNLINDSWIEDF